MSKAIGGFDAETVSRRVKKRKINKSLLVALIKTIPSNETIIDMGAGVGTCQDALTALGYTVKSVDGGENIEELTGGKVEWADLTRDCSHLYGKWDWGLFIDVGEHIPAELEGRLFAEICQIPKKGLIVSWGSPGQRGNGHVNCKTTVYIANMFARFGWDIDDLLSKRIQSRAGSFFKRRIMVLRRVS